MWWKRARSPLAYKHLYVTGLFFYERRLYAHSPARLFPPTCFKEICKISSFPSSFTFSPFFTHSQMQGSTLPACHGPSRKWQGNTIPFRINWLEVALLIVVYHAVYVLRNHDVSLPGHEPQSPPGQPGPRSRTFWIWTYYWYVARTLASFRYVNLHCMMQISETWSR